MLKQKRFKTGRYLVKDNTDTTTLPSELSACSAKTGVTRLIRSTSETQGNNSKERRGNFLKLSPLVCITIDENETDLFPFCALLEIVSNVLLNSL
jgi:hypothetical protein